MKNNILEKDISSQLFGFGDYFDKLYNLIKTEKFPQVLLLSGKKGSGKRTLITHFLNYMLDTDNYDYKNKKMDVNSIFNKNFNNDINQNIIKIDNQSGSIKIEDIRNLRSRINTTSFDNNRRFVILDDIDLYNHNCLNALLKIIEEPSKNNYFILINNQEKKLLETVSSRCIEFKFFLKDDDRISIIKSLIKKKNIKAIIDFEKYTIMPGNFILLNEIFLNNEISFENNYLANIDKLLKLYKKTKNTDMIKSTILLTEIHFHNLLINNKKDIEMINNLKIKTIKNINNFVTYNLNVNAIISEL